MRKHFIILAIIGLLLYLPSLFGPFLWDDENFVYANKYVAEFRLDKFFTDSQTAGRGKLSNYYRPIPQIIYASVHAITGFHPAAYHLINILAHIGAAGAVYYFFTILLNHEDGVGDFSQSEGKTLRHLVPSKAAEDEKKLPSQLLKLIPFLIALFFLIHPVQTETVSYISGLSDPLFVLFGFLSLIYYLRSRFLSSTLYFLLSLLSKETGIVFLGLLFLLHTLFIHQKLAKQKSHDRYIIVWLISVIKQTWAYAIVALAYLWYHLTFINQLDIKSTWGNNPYANSLTVRLLTFVNNLPAYFGLLLFPKDLFMERDYTIPIQTNIFNPSLFAFIVFITFIILILFKKKSPILWFCFLGFFIAFLPYSGLVLINGIFYEHFLYLPLVFFFAFFLLLFQSLPTVFARHGLAKGATIIWISLLITRNILRQLDWADPIRFYSQTLTHAPTSIRIINGLGMAYADRGENNLAIQQYNNGIKINPRVPNLYHNLANLYLAAGDFKSAEENYLKAIQTDPNFTFSWQSLASLYQQTGQKEKLQTLINQYSQIHH